MIKLTPYRILVYLDMPQLFLSRDALGTSYICLLHNSDEDAHICVQASAARIQGLLNGEIDLRDMFTSPEQEDTLFKASFDGRTLAAERIGCGDVSEEMLPDAGFYLPDEPLNQEESDKMLLSEAESQNAQVISFDFKDGTGMHEIDSQCLSSVLISIRSIIKSCQMKIRGADAAKKMDVKVLATMPGSFDLHMKVGGEMGLFGFSTAEDAIRGFRDLLSPDDDENLRESIKKYRGHAISSSRILIQTLLKENMTMDYRWVASVTERSISEGKTSRKSLEHIAAIYSESKELEKENKEYMGVFVASSVLNGRWKLRLDNGKTISGTCENPQDISGVTIESKRYKVFCEESFEQDPNTLVISSTRLLKGFETA